LSSTEWNTAGPSIAIFDLYFIEAGIPRVPVFGKFEGVTAVGAAQGRNRHRPGADAVRGVWKRI